MGTEEHVKKSRSISIGLRSLLAFHRTLGLSSALFVILLSLTGILLQHSSRLNLDSRFFNASFWLAWYNIEVPQVTATFTVDTNSVALIGDTLFFNTRVITGEISALVGFVELAQYSVAATPDQLFLLDEEIGLIERLESVNGIPIPIDAIATLDRELLLVQSGSVFTTVNLDSLVIESLDPGNVSIPWSTASPVNAIDNEQIRQQYGNSLISWERLILDLHSGRVFGGWGILLMDAMAVIFLSMAISGVWIWTRRRSSSRTS